ncbi:hypothetical protein ACLOJK_004874, partial [Asimina triloba]
MAAVAHEVVVMVIATAAVAAYGGSYDSLWRSVARERIGFRLITYDTLKLYLIETSRTPYSKIESMAKVGLLDAS